MYTSQSWFQRYSYAILVAMENSRAVSAALMSVAAVFNLCSIQSSASDSSPVHVGWGRGVNESESLPRTNLVA